MHRRLPIYLLLDCSESMAGGPWKAVKDGMRTMLSELQSDPMALETAAISVIGFSDHARQELPLTDVIQTHMPQLKMGSGTALGAALRLWVEKMKTEVKETTVQQKGDYKPICFILTDGEPTDTWDQTADYVKQHISGKKANVIALASGPDVDVNKLRRITDTVLVLRDQNEVSFKQFFKWVTASVSSASVGVSGGNNEGIALSPTGEGIQRAPSDAEAPVSNRYIFLHARCVSTRKFFIYRYEKRRTEQKGWFGSSEGFIYQCIAAHPIDESEFETGKGSGVLSVNTSLLSAPQPCPYCQNPAWGMCANGHVHCCPEITSQIELTCPWCDSVEWYAPATFDVGRGAG